MNVTRNDKQNVQTCNVGRGRGRAGTSVIGLSRVLGVLPSRSSSSYVPEPSTDNKTPCPTVSSTSRNMTSNSTGRGNLPLFSKPVSTRGRHTVTSSSASARRHTTSSELLRTPMSMTTHTSIDNESSSIIAISEGRGNARGEVGIAALDCRRPHLILCQISDSQSYVNTLTKINVLNPVEIIVPNTFCEGHQLSKLYTCVRDSFPSVTLTAVQRRHFNESRGLQQIQHLCACEYSSVEILVLHKFYSLSSAAALLKYIEFVQNVMFAPKSLKVEYQGSQNTTVIDVDTAHRLELVKYLHGTGTKDSLLGVLNHCCTAGGSRMLRANILQPPCLPTVIRMRQACVQEIVENPELSKSLQTILSKFIQVDHLLTLCMYIPQQNTLRAAETQLNYTLMLKTTLELLPTLSVALEGTCSEFLCAVRENLANEKFQKILDRIYETIHRDAQFSKSSCASHMQRSFSVKPNISGLLDVARKVYCELVDDITGNVSSLAEKHNLPLRVNWVASKGFHIQLTTKNKVSETDLPPEFIQVKKSRNTITCTTQELYFADQRATDALQEVQQLSNVVVYKLLVDIREHIGCLYKLCENVAELDMLLSLTHVSSTPNYVRPLFGHVLNLKESRHPMLDFISQTEPQANDIFASSDFNCKIITGPNMSGKSIYIKQVALLQIMAQIGCYVPATSATFRLADHIFSRIGFEDSIECNASTFVLELRELQYIKQMLTPTSLVIVDELCRGTSCEEGTALAFAICEDLLQTEAFIFLTSHFLFITTLQDLYCNVTNLHFQVVEELNNEGHNRLRYTHRLMPGVTQAENYGLHLAKCTAMPDSVVDHAFELSQTITANRKIPKGSVGTNSKTISYKIVSKLLELHELGTLTLPKFHEIMGFSNQESHVEEMEVGCEDTLPRQLTSSRTQRPNFLAFQTPQPGPSRENNDIVDFLTV